jgi:sporulation protein YlmC with PRC-barrel domain
MEISIKKVLRAKHIARISVRSPERDEIGDIEDVVIDLESGTIAYAVLHFYTWFQDKLFAVPWSELSLAHDDKGRFFILDTTPHALKSAPGFDPKNWPDVASDLWREEVDSHYRKAS